MDKKRWRWFFLGWIHRNNNQKPIPHFSSLFHILKMWKSPGRRNRSQGLWRDVIAGGIVYQSFTGRTDAEAEPPILWPPDVKSRLIGKDPDAGKYWGQEEKGTTEDEMVGWYHWLDGHEFEQAPGDGEGQGSLACCRPWGRKELDRLSNWTIVNCESVSSLAPGV